MPKQSSKSKPLPPKWLLLSYQPASLFSLKRSDATSMAARSNLVPTPYSIKMALLKILLEAEGNRHSSDFETWIEREFVWIRELAIRVCPPDRLVVNRNGYKLRYYNQQADKERKPQVMPLQDGFVFREWVYLEGNLQIACGDRQHRLDELRALFAQINYFGKRGGFFQFLPDETRETDAEPRTSDRDSKLTVQPMDDLGSKTTFARINPFSNEKARLDRDRTIAFDFLPLELKATSARYDFYTRSD